MRVMVDYLGEKLTPNQNEFDVVMELSQKLVSHQVYSPKTPWVWCCRDDRRGKEKKLVLF